MYEFYFSYLIIKRIIYIYGEALFTRHNPDLLPDLLINFTDSPTYKESEKNVIINFKNNIKRTLKIDRWHISVKIIQVRAQTLGTVCWEHGFSCVAHQLE